MIKQTTVSIIFAGMTKEEEYRFDHERSVGETKVGFFKMQQGDNAEALEHFKEALIAMPYNESAKTGMRLA
ncbi:hypothetical protein NK983_28280, partial [Salmonella enterica subsp. enterica serovar Typhimurium]|nr:hypothetical protein [Salmonella enterica subsp. enterica serovar Typhimurium]